MNIKDQAMEWFYDLPQRDRFIFIGVVVGALTFLIYSFMWSPITSKITTLEKTIEEQKDTLKWMQTQVEIVKQLRQSHQGKEVKSRGSQSLIGLVDQTARDSALGDAIQRIQPSSGGGVQVWLKRAVFDEVVRWLVTLGEYGVTVNSIKLRGQNEPGMVNVEIVVKDLTAKN